MATRKGMFAAFADDDEETTTQQTTTKAAPKKAAQPKPAAAKQEERPAQAKPVRPQQIDATGFDGVVGRESAPRGGRGGRGGQRGGRGGQRGGERRPRVEGEEFRPRTEGGEFRGRGRGERRQRREPVGEGDEGVAYVARKEKVDFEGKEHHFAGKNREKYHPYDRRDGTGRGRGIVKSGAGKGNLGTVEDEVKFAEATPVEAKEGEQPATEEGKVEDVLEETQPEVPAVEEAKPVEEEEEKGKLTLAEYLAQKKRSTLKKEARGHEEVKRTNLEAAAPKKEKVETITNSLRNQEVYNTAVGKTELDTLLSFQGQEDDFYVERSEGRRGGRGGRGGRGPRPEGAQRGGQRGGRQQQLRIDDNAFPTLA